MESDERCGDAQEKKAFRMKTQPLLEKDLLRRRGYVLHDVVGEGTYSKVKRASALATRRDVAIKIICCDKAPTVFRQRFLPREIAILSFVQHPHIVRVHEIFETTNPARVYIVTEFLHGGDLLEHVKEHGSVADSDARYIFYDICRAVDYLHENSIAHRDIKCENILLDRRRTGQKFYAKLCDFGFARRFKNPKSKVKLEKQPELLTNTFCGSAAYASPEILDRKTYNPMLSDVWALGIVFFITLFGSMPFDDRDIKAMIVHQKRDDVMHRRTKKVCRSAQDLTSFALRPNPKLRPSVRTLLRHSWFRISQNSKTLPVENSSLSAVHRNTSDQTQSALF